MTDLFLSPISREELKTDISDIVKKEVQTLLTSLQQTQSSQAPKYLTRKETAQKLGVSLPTLNEWTKTGLVQGYRIASRVRYKEDEVTAAFIQIKTRRNVA